MEVINKHDPNPQKRQYTHYIGRPSLFGNPFVIGKHGTRNQVIAKFEQYARNDPTIMELIRQLPADAKLGCFCAPQRCHGEVIIKLWKEVHHELV